MDIRATDDYLAVNTAAWGGRTESETALAQRAWAADVPSWGIFGQPDEEVGLIDDVAGSDVLEVGCGTAYVSAWARRRGARPVALDPTPGQLAIAAAQQAARDEHFPLVLARGEQLPFAAAAFDLVVSEYGAAIWADPHAWIPEAARVLRRGGELRFLGNHPLLMACSPVDGTMPARDRLQRSWVDMHRFDWPEVTLPATGDRPAVTEPAVVEFHLPPGAMIRLLRDSGFEVLDHIELTAHPDAVTSHEFVTPDWAGRWPHEQVWKARRR
ncbi:class I SAM-dependent methyltransferase [Euzebya sp.]|uniref:class I SAM-dependent methyltransferase n=1 Tax=Euzebya sp. TaxID=1971409 RepID=UPI003511ED02